MQVPPAGLPRPAGGFLFYSSDCGDRYHNYAFMAFLSAWGRACGGEARRFFCGTAVSAVGIERDAGRSRPRRARARRPCHDRSVHPGAGAGGVGVAVERAGLRVVGEDVGVSVSALRDPGAPGPHARHSRSCRPRRGHGVADKTELSTGVRVSVPRRSRLPAAGRQNVACPCVCPC